MIKQDDDGYWIEIEEAIASHHEEVFPLLTTASGLTQWFPVAAQVDLRTGGTIVFGWDAKFKAKTTVAILRYEAGGKVVWDWHAALEDRHAPVYWEVNPSVEDGSIVRMRQGPFATDESSLVAMANEAESWRRRLCNMRSVMEAQHDMRTVRPL